MTDISERPTLFWLVKTLWESLSGKTDHDWVKMRPVRSELMRAVYSQLTDADAAARIEGLVRSNPQAAKMTMRQVRETMKLAPGYETDRAYRILAAAISGTAPEPVRPEDVELFERERELGWLPLDDAFDRLCAAVPELSAIRARAKELAASPSKFGIVHDVDNNMLVVPSDVLPSQERLVGPDSRHPDPLIRSWLAQTVVARYVVAVLTDATQRAAWEPGLAGLTISSSIAFGAAEQ